MSNAQLGSRERFLNIPVRSSLTVTGEVVRIPKSGPNDYGILKWGELYIFVRGKLIKKRSDEFQLKASVKCSVVSKESHPMYQAVELHEITQPA